MGAYSSAGVWPLETRTSADCWRPSSPTAAALAGLALKTAASEIGPGGPEECNLVPLPVNLDPRALLLTEREKSSGEP